MRGATQGDLLDLVNADPRISAVEDRDKIRAAILADGKAHGGHVSRNRVRQALTNASGHLDVWHKRIGPQYHALLTLGLLRHSDDPLHIEVNNDATGRNAGKIARGLCLTDEGWAAS